MKVIWGFSIALSILGIYLISVAIEGRHGIAFLFRMITSKNRFWTAQTKWVPAGWEVKTQTAAILATACFASASLLVSVSAVWIALH